MSDFRPGLNPRRLLNLMEAAVKRCQLDLSNVVVLTEAASGPYMVTPILAAMAGARHVFALTQTTRYGTVENIAAHTLELGRLAGVEAHVEIVSEKIAKILAQADIITNSGHVRPIDATVVNWLKPTAVIPLMYEAWEFRAEDLDLAACRQRGVPVAGTNERHPAVDAFSFLGVMAIKLLLDAGISVQNCHLLLLCDNPFASFISGGLVAAGARVDVSDRLPVNADNSVYDAIVVALQPGSEPVIDANDAARIASLWPGAVMVQFWGDLDRSALSANGVYVWPIEAPTLGHMGVLPSEVGPEPVVRLQAGGLKVGEVLFHCRLENASAAKAEEIVEREGWGQRLKHDLL
jgi:hypothetical protein